MRAVIQRSLNSSVLVEGKIVGQIERGIVVLLGVEKDDNSQDVQYLVRKITGLRIFEDGEGKFNLSLEETAGQVLAVSQFTLLADCRKGRRPSFTAAALPDEAKKLYDEFCSRLAAEGIKVEKGVFGAKMLLKIKNDGPVTLILDSRAKG
ncbi:MAG TPA: D-tyrosyl-tRNA(Tyr) deacylase [Firmicutes bacterium]|nr:D-tyrosyl-tRNA(Tyr) deacylase [Bacillota bacterium]